MKIGSLLYFENCDIGIYIGEKKQRKMQEQREFEVRDKKGSKTISRPIKEDTRNSFTDSQGELTGRISGAVWIDARNFHFFFTPVLELKDLYYRYLIRSFSSELM